MSEGRRSQFAMILLMWTLLLAEVSAAYECPPPPDDWSRGGEFDLSFPHHPRELLVALARLDKQSFVERELLQVELGIDEEIIFPEPGIARIRLRGSGGDEELKRVANKLVDNHQLYRHVEPNYCLYPVDPPQQLETLKSGEECEGQWAIDTIDAAGAWARTKGSKEVVVAVLDTGLATGHGDLAAQLWKNPCETFDGVDNGCGSSGGNGMIDDMHGWNFAENTPIIEDDDDHGSEVAGVIGAVHDNGQCIQGLNAETSLMALKTRGGDGGQNVGYAISALAYAVANGADVANVSWSTNFSHELKLALEAAYQAGIVVVAAAGRGELSPGDLDEKVSYPCSFGLANVICVAGTTCGDNLEGGSSWGKETVHLGAPGYNILSTARFGRCTERSGPSLAAPHVAGVAALIRSMCPNSTVQDVVDRIVCGTKYAPALDGKTISKGRLDAGQALSPSCTTTIQCPPH